MDAKKLLLELKELHDEGVRIVTPDGGGSDADIEIPTQFEYQAWYSKTLAVVRQLLPDRVAEFEQIYRVEKRRRRDDINLATYSISDALVGIELLMPKLTAKSGFAQRFVMQLAILDSAAARLDSTLANLDVAMRSELMDDDLRAAEELISSGHLRSAGAVAGVVLEGHLGSRCAAHGIKFRKKHPTISDFNDRLKDAKVIDVPTWRRIQRLGDIRNLCVHNRDPEPTLEQVEDLVNDTDKVIHEVF